MGKSSLTYMGYHIYPLVYLKVWLFRMKVPKSSIVREEGIMHVLINF